MVAAAKAAEYPWSNLPKFAGKDRLEWLDGSTALAAAQVLLHQIRAVLDGCEEPESIGSAAPY